MSGGLGCLLGLRFCLGVTRFCLGVTTLPVAGRGIEFALQFPYLAIFRQIGMEKLFHVRARNGESDIGIVLRPVKQAYPKSLVLRSAGYLARFDLAVYYLRN